MASVDMALNLVPRQLLALAPRLAQLLLFSDLLEIETDLPEIEIFSYELENIGLIFELSPPTYLDRIIIVR